MHNVPKCSGTLWKSCSKCCEIFKVSYHFETLCIKGLTVTYFHKKVQSLMFGKILNALLLSSFTCRGLISLSLLRNWCHLRRRPISISSHLKNHSCLKIAAFVNSYCWNGIIVFIGWLTKNFLCWEPILLFEAIKLLPEAVL